MAATLTGTLTGASRSDIVARVKEAATKYFGVGCISVVLTSERIEDEAFAADYSARVFHDVEHRSYGPGVCRGCGKDDWPHSPLNETR